MASHLGPGEDDAHTRAASEVAGDLPVADGMMSYGEELDEHEKPVGLDPITSEFPSMSATTGALSELETLGAGFDGVHIDLSAEYDLASAPIDGDAIANILVTLSPVGEPLVDAQAGPVCHVILALDVSASMNHADKYPVLTQALECLIEDLQSPDAGEVLISIVLFAFRTEVLVDAVPAAELDPRKILADIDRSPIRFGRYTDIVGALNRAGRIAYDYNQENRAVPVRIYLLTDGKPQDMDGARDVFAKVRRFPVDVDALAFGADADVIKLQELVSGGRGGTVKHVRPENLEDAFGRIGVVSQRIVAKRSLFDFRFGPGVVGGAAFRFRPGRHRYSENTIAAGRAFATDLGTLESGREYSLMLRVRLPQTDRNKTFVGHARLRIPWFGGPLLFEKDFYIERHAGGAERPGSAEVIEACTILDALDSDDPVANLKALKLRRKLYVSERRDPILIQLLDKAIDELEERGSLDGLSGAERAAIVSHTRTNDPRDAKPPPGTQFPLKFE